MNFKSILFIITINLFYSGAFCQSWQSDVTGFCSDENEGVSIKLYNGKQYFTGAFKGNLNIGFNSAIGYLHNDIFVGKADLNGFTEWIIALKGSEIDRPNHIDVVDDKIMLSGTFSDTLFIENDTLITPYQNGAFLAYFDTLGNYLNAFVPDVYNASIRDFQVDSQGNIIFCGDFFQHFNYGGFSMNVLSGINFFLMKYDPVQDSILWGVHAYGNSSEGTRISIDTNNNIYTVGLYNDGTILVDTLINTGNANHNLFVAKFNTNGEKQWLNTINGTEEAHGFGIVCDDSSNVFIAGEFQGTVDFQGSSVTSNGSYDIVLMKLDENGNTMWIEGCGGLDTDEGYDLVLDANQDPILLAEAGIDPIYQGVALNTFGWNEPLLLKIQNNSSNLIWNKRLPSTISSGIVQARSISIEEEYIGITGINRSSIIVNGNETFAPNAKDFFTAILKDSLTYFLFTEVYEQANRITVYPNPTSDYFKINSEQNIERVKIYTMNGVLIKDISIDSNDQRIDIEKINTGLYIIQICYENHVITRKIHILDTQSF